MILFTFALLALLFPGLYVAAGAEVRLATGVGEPRLVVPDHGFVRHNQIDDFFPDMPRRKFLIGITSFTSCCSRDFTTDRKEIGWWFYPNGTVVPKIQNEAAVWNFFSSRYKKNVFLYRRRGGANGIHRLDIPVSASKNETFYVGLYRSAGNPRVTSMPFALASEYTVGETPKFSVTCNSVGGPATNVTWTRDGKAVSGGNFTATRRLDNPVTAAYTLTLSVAGRQGGVYRCQVAKSGPGVSGDPASSSMEIEVKVASPPTNFIAKQVNKTTVRISWTPPAPKEAVTGYQIHYMEVESLGTRGEFMTAPETDHRLIHNFQAGIYSFTMLALSEHLPSEVVGPIPLIMKAVPAITVMTVEVATTLVWLQWSGVNNVNQPESVNQPDSLQITFQYTMESLHNGFCSDHQQSVIVTLTNGSIQQYNITGLQEDSTYNITIVAENAAGKSAPSEVVITTLQAAPSGTPQGVTRVNTTSTVITVEWREIPCIDRNGDIVEYTVRYYSISGCNDTILRSASNKLAATLVDLIPFANYSIEVAAVNVNGTGPFSTPVYLRTDGDTPSGTPQEITIVDTTSTEITLQWREVPCIERNGDIIGYTVRYSISGSNITLRNYSDTVATLVELTPFTNYSIEVAAVNINGTGPFSTPVYMRTDDDTTGSNIVYYVIAGVVCGAVLVVIAIVCIAAIVCRTKQRKRKHVVTKSEVSAYFENEYEGEAQYCTIDKEETETKFMLPVSENLPTESKPIPVEENNFAAPEFEKFPEDVYAKEGQTVSLQVEAKGTPTPVLSWHHNEDPVVGDHSTTLCHNGTLEIPRVEPRHVGVYRLVATNVAGSSTKEVKVALLEDDDEEPYHMYDAPSGSVPSSSVPFSEFTSYVAHNHANNNQGFTEQYKSLESGDQHSVDIATAPKKKSLNRFKNIVPYDDNRIILRPIPGIEDCTCDYINASYVDGYCNPNVFIATQAPLPKTVTHFWHLVWQENPVCILMLTNLIEGNKVKCHKYWPDSGKISFGPFQITIVQQQIFADYAIRKFEVELVGSTEHPHSVTQFDFTEWPDHGVPEYATAFLGLHRRIKAFLNQAKTRGPTLIHCSAGVGRTGTFIAIDTVLDQVEREKVLDIDGTINKIRQQRMKLVQTVNQYIFIHDAILEVTLCGDTQIPSDTFSTALKELQRIEHGMSGLESQFHVLSQVTLQPDAVPHDVSLQYKDMNRSTSYLPPDKWRVPLKGGHPEYIHATLINGYKQQKAFIIAEGPMESTRNNFWKMVYERKCGAIVMLSSLVEDGKEVCCCYWPDSGSTKYGNVTVEVLSVAENRSYEGYKLRKFSLSVKSGEAHHVTQFCIENWGPSGKCANGDTVLEVVDEVGKVQRRTGNNPIVVHCSDTVGRSGMFCAIATTIERCKSEGVVDVFQVVKAIREHKPGAVATEEQYSYIFKVVLLYLDSFNTYANFK